VVPSVGDPDLSVTYGGETILENRIGRDVVHLCPPLDDNVINISVTAYDSFTSYTLTVTEYPDSISPLLDYYNLHVKPREFGDGLEQWIVSPYETKTELKYLFLLISLNLSCTFHVESHGNTLLSLNLNGSVYTNAPITYSGRSSIDVSICDELYSMDSEIMFEVNTSDLRFKIFATTANFTEIISLHSLHILDSVNVLNSEIYLSFESASLCNVTNIWSSTSNSPLNPPQRFLFSSDVPFDQIKWDLPTQSEGNDRVIYTYLLLDDEFDGTAEEVMRHFSFTVGPGFVDESGRRLVGDGVIHPVPNTNITCQSEVITELVNAQKESKNILVGLDFLNISDAYNTFLSSDSIQANLTWIACKQQIEYMNSLSAEDKMQLCGDWECTNLTLTTYQVDKSQIDKGWCNSSASLVTNVKIDAVWYKECKESVYSVTTGKTGRPCIRDEDCIFPWMNTTNLTYMALNNMCDYDAVSNDPPPCDTFLGICGDTHEEAEELFWWCFVETMSLDVQLTLSLRGIDVCNITDLKSSFSVEECVSVSGTGMAALSHRTHYRYTAPDATPIYNSFAIEDDTTSSHCECFQAIGFEYDFCLDRLCNKPPQCEYSSYDSAPKSLLLPSEISEKSDVCSYSLLLQEGDNVLCLEEHRCNWNPSLSVGPTDVTHCSGDDFCGVHFEADDEFYREMVHVSEIQCAMNSGRVCVTPYGSLAFGETESEACSDIGYCTVDCPNEANHSQCLPVDSRKASLCYNDSDTIDQSMCSQMSGEWMSGAVGQGGYMCVFPLQNTRKECQRNGNIFIECDSFSISECDSNQYLSCYLSDLMSSCRTKEDCRQRGVERCSDTEYFVNYLTSPPTYGSCVLPFVIEVTDVGIRNYCYHNTIPMSLG
jgi:hypothetical protein